VVKIRAAIPDRLFVPFAAVDGAVGQIGDVDTEQVH